MPLSQRIGGPGEGFKVAMATLDVFRSTVGAAALGFARRALDEALGRAVVAPALRRAPGRPPAHARPRSPRWRPRSTPRRSSSTAPPGRRTAAPPRVTREAAMAKMHATEAAQGVIDKAVQIFGGLGVTKGVKVEELYREIRALRIYEGATRGAEDRHRPRAAEAPSPAAGEGCAEGRVRRWRLTRTASPTRPLRAGEVSTMSYTAHVDTFARDNLPPREQWPDFLFTRPELQYPERLNCVHALPRPLGRGGPGRRALPYRRRPRRLTYARAPGAGEPHRQRPRRATSASCRATACCCARPTTR